VVLNGMVILGSKDSAYFDLLNPLV